MDVLTKDNNVFYNVLCFLITENEKLFDRSDARLYWKTVFHLAVISHHYYISLFATGLDLETSPAIEIKTLKKYRGGYLTGWNFLFQTTFLSLALLHDALEWVDKHETKIGRLIKYWRDVVFSGLAVPVTLFVTGMFWSVYLIDRELVFPSVYDEIVPWWFNHCVHTNIFIIICVETLLQPRRRPADWKMENIFVITVLVAYAVMYYSIYFFSHRWLYKVFAIMTWWQVCLFQCLIWGSSYFFYSIQYPINRLIHGSVDDEAANVKNIGEVDKEIVNDVKNCDIGKVNEVVNGDYSKNRISKVGSSDISKTIIENGIKEGIVNKNNFAAETNETEDGKETFDKSWSLKYRMQRSQFKNTTL